MPTVAGGSAPVVVERTSGAAAVVNEPIELVVVPLPFVAETRA